MKWHPGRPALAERRGKSSGCRRRVCVWFALACSPALAQEQIEVTATRLPEPVSTVPADVTIISAAELQARHVTTLAGALALVPGVEAPPGGDAGPASAVPSIWGLHEFDAFLLVVDGVPWGGAFNPAIPTLDLANVQRIEVLKGSAPVIYGATAFVGIIQVIHNAAGSAPDAATLGVGNHGSWRGQAAVNLPSPSGFTQSLTLDGEHVGFDDPRESITDGHALYRATAELGPGTLRLDGYLGFVRTVPNSPVVRIGDALNSLTPLDANYNPADARIDENKYQLVLGYTLPTRLGDWQSTASYAYSDIRDIRGFLRPTLIDDGSQNADSQNQTRQILDSYFDTHLATHPVANLDIAIGADLLYGLARQGSINGAYYVPLNGRVAAPPTTALHIDEINSVYDSRRFVGQYIQADWHPLAWLDIVAGARLNETYEDRNSRHVDGFDTANDLALIGNRATAKPTETLGASLRLWHDGTDQAVLYGDVRESFKPAAIDFGPDYTPDILQPERAFSAEAGLKGSLANTRLIWDVETFRLDFKNLVVQTQDAAGNPLQQNAGGERLQGAEADLTLHPLRDLAIRAMGSYHDARFTQYIATESGANVNAAGRQLPLSPEWLAAIGLLYTPARGFQATAAANYIGRRYLDIANSAPTPSYITLDASFGYRFDRSEITLSATNLTDQRPPVTASEFGDSSFYLLPGRTVFLDVGVPI